MPIYEYQCQACGHGFDQLQKISDPILTVCPQCHESKLQKLVSRVGFQLKGTGWYVTDFRDKKDNSKSEAKKTDAENQTKTPAEAKKTDGKEGTKDSASTAE